MTHDSKQNAKPAGSQGPALGATGSASAEGTLASQSSSSISQHSIADSWQHLRQHTSARIALGRAGGSLTTGEWLDFKQAHASARDAVHEEFDAEALAASIAELDVLTLEVTSAAGDRATYLKRPDLGRRLSEESQAALAALPPAPMPPDLAIIVSDGLSATAVARQSAPLLSALLPKLLGDGWRLAPIVIARFGRVAIEDEIGALLGARQALILLGERPGLGSPDSLGAYLVYEPQPGRTDAERNCVSNIRPAGLAPELAAETIHYLLTRSREQKLSGVKLKDDRALPLDPPPPALPNP